MNDYKILVTAPQHSSKMYAWKEYSSRLKELTYPNVDFYFVDNSETTGNTTFIKNEGFKCDFLPTSKNENVFSKISRSHENCRKYFLEGDYDYMLHLETDIIPPEDIIERLLMKGQPVVSALYDSGVGFERMAMLQQNAPFEHRNIRGFKSPTYLGMMEPLILNGDIQKVFACGLGCVLIRRDVVEMIPFRYDERFLASADTHWANDLYENNIPIFVATEVYCNHRNESWHTKEITN